jgi:zinc D-Ala-D-Ala dipeptidase
MRLHAIVVLCITALFPVLAHAAEPPIPPGFVYLRQAAPAIQQDMRYAGPHNFTGKPVPGYGAGECLLLREAALALERAQLAAEARGLSLKVYDCYRPIRAVEAFAAWAEAPEDGRTRHFYPSLQKPELMRGYIARRSAHSQGLAVDLTLVPRGSTTPEPGPRGPCTAPQSEREADNSVDMGTAFDCFDPKSATAAPGITAEQRRFRLLLKTIMAQAGFRNYSAEWWHYSYASRRAGRSFDIPIQRYTAPAP